MTRQIVYVLIAVFFSGTILSSCFKDLPKKHIVFEQDFSKGKGLIKIYDFAAVLVDSPKLFNFNGLNVLGRFNNNKVELDLDSLPEHNMLRFQFDLYIHDKWEGNYLNPSTRIPDVWLMRLNGNPYYLTTFSTTAQSQSFPANYLTNHQANANAWAKLPGVCALADQPDGTTLYKIDFMLGHTSSKIKVDWSDALQPFNQPCQKSWSIDNIVITASAY